MLIVARYKGCIVLKIEVRKLDLPHFPFTHDARLLEFLGDRPVESYHRVYSNIAKCTLCNHAQIKPYLPVVSAQVDTVFSQLFPGFIEDTAIKSRMNRNIANLTKQCAEWFGKTQEQFTVSYCYYCSVRSINCITSFDLSRCWRYKALELKLLPNLKYVFLTDKESMKRWLGIDTTPLNLLGKIYIVNSYIVCPFPHPVSMLRDESYLRFAREFMSFFKDKTPEALIQGI